MTGPSGSLYCMPKLALGEVTSALLRWLKYNKKSTSYQR